MRRTLPILAGLILLVLAAGVVSYILLPKSQMPEDAASLAAAGNAAGGAASGKTAGTTDEPVVTGRFEPVAATPDIAGTIVSDPQGDVDLGRYKGKALLINVWATWCAPCVAEMPSLDRLQAKLGGDRFAVLPVAVDEPSMAAVQDFMKKYQLQNLPVLLDLNHAIDQKIRLQSLPASLLVSPEGKIVARFTGDNRWDCGKPLAALESFAKEGTVPTNTLEPCTE